MKKTCVFFTVIILSVASFAQQQFVAESPRAIFAGKSSGDITLDEIKMTGELRSTNSEIQIVHFAITLISDGIFISRNSNSNKVTDQMMEQLKKLEKDQKFIIEEIRGMKPGGEIIQLKPLKFTIK